MRLRVQNGLDPIVRTIDGLMDPRHAVVSDTVFVRRLLGMIDRLADPLLGRLDALYVVLQTPAARVELGVLARTGLVNRLHVLMVLCQRSTTNGLLRLDGVKILSEDLESQLLVLGHLGLLRDRVHDGERGVEACSSRENCEFPGAF